MQQEMWMDFDTLAPIQIGFKYNGKTYILREASEDAAARYKNFLLRSAKLGADGRPVSFEGGADSNAVLLSLCLYEADAEGNLRLNKDNNPDSKFLVPLATIRTWQTKVVKKLVDKVKEISDLEDEDSAEELEKRIKEDQDRLAVLKTSKNGADEKVKNEFGATEGISG